MSLSETTRKTTAAFRLTPVIDVGGNFDPPVVGWGNIWQQIMRSVPQRRVRSGKSTTVVAFECYQGVDIDAVRTTCETLVHTERIVLTQSLMKAESLLNAMVQRELTNDPVFGFMTRLTIEDFFDTERVAEFRRSVLGASADGKTAGYTTVIIGPGAAFIAPDPEILVYADMTRWEIQQLQRDHVEGNLGTGNRLESAKALYKRSFFVDWRILDRHKQGCLPAADFVVSATDRQNPKMISGEAFRDALKRATKRPIMLKPFFDPGVWGGRWMKENFGLDQSAPNYAWCFNCVPEEQGIVLAIGGDSVEFPAIDLVLLHPDELMGARVRSRFGREFPIRFDFLDTVDGQNLSLQVHPLTEYIQEQFGMHYTQDESYYILESAPNARVYLGLREDARPEEMRRALFDSQEKHKPFDADAFVQSWPAKKHDHFLIPAGTVHCSGANTLVLEISATPYIFTFKMWDWGRVDLDGKPRPVHLDHGLVNVQWNRRRTWVERHLINRVSEVSRADGVVQERTGLHEYEFIDTYRYWFDTPFEVETGGSEEGSVNVLNLVEGMSARIESPTGTFAPFDVAFAETVVIPAAVGTYRISPLQPSSGKCALLVASVRM